LVATDRMNRGETDTIAAIATGTGASAIGIVRIAGQGTRAIAQAMLGFVPEPRRVHTAYFYGGDGEQLDRGLALFFAAPRSFTGDDVLELQGHGGPVVLDLILERVTALGARLARPGEFTERAFLNGKLDLTQAEAVADLIEAATASAARLAVRTLQGAFAQRVGHLAEGLLELRTRVEASLDFPDDDLERLDRELIGHGLQDLLQGLGELQHTAQQGCVVNEGVRIAIAGPPNAGKSSLMNALVQYDRAIVTEVPGTTRDVLTERIEVDGLPVELVDTAGIRRSEDPIECEGVRRAEDAVRGADRVLWVVDDAVEPNQCSDRPVTDWVQVPLIWIRNKIDIRGVSPFAHEGEHGFEIGLSAKTGEGLDLLRGCIRRSIGLQQGGEGRFLARRRHVEALQQARAFVESARIAYAEGLASELIAEDLRLAQRALGQITGALTSEDLLDRIFSRFCIGK